MGNSRVEGSGGAETRASVLPSLCGSHQEPVHAQGPLGTAVVPPSHLRSVVLREGGNRPSAGSWLSPDWGPGLPQSPSSSHPPPTLPILLPPSSHPPPSSCILLPSSSHPPSTLLSSSSILLPSFPILLPTSPILPHPLPIPRVWPGPEEDCGRDQVCSEVALLHGGPRCPENGCGAPGFRGCPSGLTVALAMR